MSKQLKNYLHLHLRCECWVQGQVEAHPIKLTGISYDDQVGEIWCYFENTETGYALLEDVKPILRPLPDMTGKEVIELFHLSYKDANYQFEEFQKVDNNEFGWRARNQNGMECFVPANSFKPEVFHWLLSRHFDLFGLIDAGLAIDKTKQTQSHE